MDQFLGVARYDHAIMVAAEIRQISDRLEGILGEDKGATFQTLEPAEDLKHVFAIVARRHCLAIDSHVVEPLDRLPSVSVDD